MALGVYGIPGIMAYLRLTDLGVPKGDETLLVSTVASATGSIFAECPASWL